MEKLSSISRVQNGQIFFKNLELQLALDEFNLKGVVLAKIKNSKEFVKFKFGEKEMIAFTTGFKLSENEMNLHPTKVPLSKAVIFDNFTTFSRDENEEIISSAFEIIVNEQQITIESKELLLQSFKFPPNITIKDGIEPLILLKNENKLSVELGKILQLMENMDNSMNLRIFVITKLNATEAALFGRNFPVTKFDKDFFAKWDNDRRISAGFVAFLPQFSKGFAKELLIKAFYECDSFIELQGGKNPWTAQALKRGTQDIDSSVNLLGEILREIASCLIDQTPILEMVPKEDWDWFGLSDNFLNFTESSLIWK